MGMTSSKSQCEMEYRSLAAWVAQLLRWEWETPNWFMRKAIWEREMSLQAWELERLESSLGEEDLRLAEIWLAIDRRDSK
jgi:hypothetical protein